jgi:hypothetical protein
MKEMTLKRKEKGEGAWKGSEKKDGEEEMKYWIRIVKELVKNVAKLEHKIEIQEWQIEKGRKTGQLRQSRQLRPSLYPMPPPPPPPLRTPSTKNNGRWMHVIVNKKRNEMETIKRKWTETESRIRAEKNGTKGIVPSSQESLDGKSGEELKNIATEAGLKKKLQS